MGSQEDRREDLQAGAKEDIGVCFGSIGGSVETVTIIIDEEEEDDMRGRLVELRDAQILLDACEALKDRPKEAAPWVSVDELLQSVLRINKKRKGDPYWAADLKSSQLGVMIAKVGIKSERISVHGGRVRGYLVEDLEKINRKG